MPRLLPFGRLASDRRRVIPDVHRRVLCDIQNDLQLLLDERPTGLALVRQLTAILTRKLRRRRSEPMKKCKEPS